MSDGSAPRAFDIVRRGYERQQVDDTFVHLVSDLTALRDERDALRRISAELEERVVALETQSPGQTGGQPVEAATTRGLGERIERILGVVEEEAADLRATTAAEVRAGREAAQAEADAVRLEARTYAEQTRAQVDTHAQQLVDVARKEAEEIRAEADRLAEHRRTEAETVFARAQAKANEATASLETVLAQRREKADREFATRIAAAQSQIDAAEANAAGAQAHEAQIVAEAERRAAQTMEAAAGRADKQLREATAQAEQQLHAAAARADEQVRAAEAMAAERLRQGEARAQQIKLDAERELAALTERRDKVRSQLTAVRQMLAALTQSAAEIDPLADDDDDSPAAAPPRDRAGTEATVAMATRPGGN